ncbi:MAG: hypothetical protein QM770_07450 [Tepidisphaeraceae bacterium]
MPERVEVSYVVLRHTGIDRPHFDLLIDLDPNGLVPTWRLDRWPDPNEIEALPRHRRLYLDYEGPISNNRGEVRRVEQGTVSVALDDAGAWRVEFGSSQTLNLPQPP